MKLWTVWKIWTICMIGFLFMPSYAWSQDWQGLIMVDSRAGYSTNSALNPFFGGWNQSTSSGYGFVSSTAQLQKLGDFLSADITAGGVYEPFFNDREVLRGGFGLLNLRYRFSSDWSAGVETGGSTMTRMINRQSAWIQPMLAWSPTLFSQIRLKTGSTFRARSSAEEEPTEGYRFDHYGFEYEFWPRFNWQIRTGWYGNLDDPSENQSLQLQVDHTPISRLRVGLRLHADQYQFSQTVNSTTEGPGGSPVGGPGGGAANPGGEDFMVVDEKDRIFRAGVSLQYQLHKTFSVMVNADHMSLRSTASEETFQDYQFSAGFRYSFRPFLGNRGKAAADWRQNDERTVSLRINYTGDGQLYITGDFNDWHRPGIPLSRQTSRQYAAQLNLDPGAYEYKILLIDGDEERWIELTGDTYTVRDGFGGTNGLVFID
ncbi:MAG: glycogen-binding domain-containing protein [Balneolaceae bacterium]